MAGYDFDPGLMSGILRAGALPFTTTRGHSTPNDRKFGFPGTNTRVPLKIRAQTGRGGIKYRSKIEIVQGVLERSLLPRGSYATVAPWKSRE